MPAQRPTLEQVAAHAGVSRATVSRVVNGAGTVDPRMAERVQESVRELGFVPNAAARALMTRRVDTVALVAAESAGRVFGDPFFAAIARGASHELARSGVHMVLSMTQGADDLTRLENFLRGGHVDGVLLVSEHGDQDIAGVARAAGLEVVVGGRPLATADGLAYVDNDNASGGRLAAEHLRSLGRRRIGVIAGPADMSAGIDRLEGFAAGLGDGFDPRLVERSDFTSAGGLDAAARLLRREPALDGLFAGSDLMALGAVSALREAGRSVPHDVAVVGFDDVDLAAVATPPLTTIRQRVLDQGRLMAQLLLSRLERPVAQPMPELAAHVDGPAAPGIVLPVELVVRQSA